jgi:hypothetical protein
LRFVRAVLTVLGVTLLSAALLAAPASAETQRAPLSLDVSTQSRMAGPAVGTLVSSCADQWGCGWTGSSYTGTVYGFPNTAGWYSTPEDIRSAQNRFNWRYLAFYDYISGEKLRCLNAGSSFPGPFPANARLILVGPSRSSC